MTNEHLPRPAFDADEADALQAIGWGGAAPGSTCPDSALLLAAEDGVPDDAVAFRLRAHVAACPTCQFLAKDLAALFDDDPIFEARARIGGRIHAAPRPSRRPLFWWLTASGLVATAAAAILVVGPLGRVGDVAPPPAPESPGGGGAVPPTVFLGGRPAIPRPEPEITLRGESTAVPLGEQVAQALDAADAGDLAGAIGRLTDLVRRQDTSADARLALGAILLRADRVAEALPVLDRARTLAGTGTTDEFEWYLAVALVRSNETARATAILEPLCRRSTARGALACAGLAEIRRNPPR